MYSVVWFDVLGIVELWLLFVSVVLLCGYVVLFELCDL